jgi:hypothetical protein
VVHRKGLGSDAAYATADFYIMLEKEFPHKIIIRMGHNQRPVAMDHPEIGIEDPKQRIPAKLKPLGQNCIVNMPQPINIAEPGGYRCCEHINSLFSILFFLYKA